MADYLIRHLRSKIDEHTAFKQLNAQWNMDEQLIPKALQNIGNLFPHYSRHDESHSKQILVNIERLLGPDTLKLLSATDTWLLLEAAYWHDIGMVVPYSELNAAFSEPEFKTLFEEIKLNRAHDLNGFCLSFNFELRETWLINANSPLDFFQNLQQLLAEFFRKKHAERAGRIVESPWINLGLSSPRTELIPNRLFRLLARICTKHGESFDSAMELPFREAGMAQEDCHPRFIACMLRVGDLLDLDDNRFCPVMQKVAGDQRPLTSIAHEKKHLALRHLRLDKGCIDATAVCSDIDSYFAAYEWFEWLKKELLDQSAHWPEIVPFSSFGFLPKVGNIEVKLEEGGIEVLEPGKIPKFTLQEDGVMQLLQGGSFYKDSFSYIRELVQNAVDATNIRLWLDNKDFLQNATPSEPAVQDILARSPITISFSKNADSNSYTLCIEDKGVGVSRADLKYMLVVAGSGKNKSRRDCINEMPDWMRPSGIFGIGFQSVFQLTEKVLIETTSYITGESLSLVLHSPTGNDRNKGRVEIRSTTAPGGAYVSLKVSGTKFTVVIRQEKLKISKGGLGRLLSLWRDRDRGFINLGKPIFDPVLHPAEYSDVVEFCAKLLSITQSISKSTRFNFSGFLQFAKPVRDELPQKDLTLGGDPVGEEKCGWENISLKQESVWVRYSINACRQQEGSVSFFYRGATVDDSPQALITLIPFVSISVDIVAGRADQWLQMSRDGFLENRVSDLENILLTVFSRAAVELKKQGSIVSQLISYAIAVIRSRFRDCVQDFIPSNDWYSMPLYSENKFSDLLDGGEKFVSFTGDQNARLLDGYQDFGFDLQQKSLIMKEWLSGDRGICLQFPPGVYGIGGSGLPVNHAHFKFVGNKAQPYCEGDFPSIMFNLLSGYSCRYALPIYDKTFEKLRLKYDSEGFPGVRHYLPFEDKSVFEEKEGWLMLLPFRFVPGVTSVSHVEVGELDALCDYVMPHLVEPCDKGEIKKLYGELVKKIDSLMEASVFALQWREVRGLT